jgi:adenosylmethionine-8-amino-7-oxononanoate aminotransferase
MKKLPGHVFPRELKKPLPIAVKAEGIWLEDDAGHRYMDASGGAVVVNVGHGRQEIAKAVYNQILNYHYIHPSMLNTPVVAELAEGLAVHAPDGIDRFYFLTSGSEAVETAIKLARQIHLANDRPERFRLVSRWKSYHGLTMGALSAMGRTAFRTPYAPMLKDAVHIPPPYCLRCSYGLEPSSCSYRCALALEETIENLSPDTVSAFLAETISGGTLAAYPPPTGYWEVIREICDRYQVLLILDEVMCGECSPIS